MKNSRIRDLLFGLLVVASIGSYAFINSVTTVEECKPKCNMQKIMEEEAETSSELPDVKIFKKIIETGKQFVTSSKTQF